MSPLHVFTARFNPLRWRRPHQHYVDWAHHMRGLGAEVTVIECAYGEAPFECEIPGTVTHIGVRADSWAWTKECLLNIGVQRRPEAKYICWADSDVFPRRPDWAAETVAALQHYRVVQPWRDCYDLGPDDSHQDHWRSFCHQYVHGHPIVVGEGQDFHKFWIGGGGQHHYPHPGYMWAIGREALNLIGGLFEYGGMGAADHHQAVAMLGMASRSFPSDVSPSYKAMLEAWQRRARHAINGRIGYVAGTIEHRFHGAKVNRQYWDRWQMFLRHGFDPISDLKRNTWGVLEFAGNKPELEHEWDQYLRSRREDDNFVSQTFRAPDRRHPPQPQPPISHPGPHPPKPPQSPPPRHPAPRPGEPTRRGTSP